MSAATDAEALIGRALEELKLTRYGWPKTNRPTGHMKNVVALLHQAEETLVPPPPQHPTIDLGPIIPGGQSIRLHDLTHITDGMTEHGSVWPAFDDGVGHPGMAVLAPENLTVTGHGHAVRRDGSPNGLSINIAVGKSGIEYWIGHLENLVPVGAVKKGARLGTISPRHEAPHVHIGINAVKVLGHDFLHHTDYTHGAPIVGAQLAAKGL